MHLAFHLTFSFSLHEADASPPPRRQACKQTGDSEAWCDAIMFSFAGRMGEPLECTHAVEGSQRGASRRSRLIDAEGGDEDTMITACSRTPLRLVNDSILGSATRPFLLDSVTYYE